jgi:hypothetical protein
VTTKFPKMTPAMERALVEVIGNRRMVNNINQRTREGIQSRGYLTRSGHSIHMPRIVVSKQSLQWWKQNSARYPSVTLDNPWLDVERLDACKMWVAEFERIREDMPRLRAAGWDGRAKYLAKRLKQLMAEMPDCIGGEQ